MTQEQVQIMLLKMLFKKKNYEFFEKGKFNVNIFGIRSLSRQAGNFNDWLGIIYKDENNVERCEYYAATTDAGTYWLRRPMNVKGTALLVPAQYKNCYQIGLHKKKYEALVQVAPVKVYRDNNKNLIEDMKTASIEEGNFGINIHRSHPFEEREENIVYSAGCQVFQNPWDFSRFMQIVKKSAALYGNSFTYTLLNSEEFDELPN